MWEGGLGDSWGGMVFTQDFRAIWGGMGKHGYDVKTFSGPDHDGNTKKKQQKVLLHGNEHVSCSEQWPHIK